jgi:hypothetical protein
MDRDRLLRSAAALAERFLKTSLQKRKTLIEPEDRSAESHHRFPDTAMQNALRCSLQVADLSFLLHHTLPEHLASRDLLAERFFQQLQLLLKDLDFPGKTFVYVLVTQILLHPAIFRRVVDAGAQSTSWPQERNRGHADGLVAHGRS